MDETTLSHLKHFMQSAKYLPKRIARIEKDRDEIKSALDKIEYRLSLAKDELKAAHWILATIGKDRPEIEKYMQQEESVDE